MNGSSCIGVCLAVLGATVGCSSSADTSSPSGSGGHETGTTSTNAGGSNAAGGMGGEASSTTGTNGTGGIAGTGGGSGTGGGIGGGPTDRRPPSAGAPHAGDGNGAVFAISKLYFGDTDPDDSPDKINGWKNYGYDVDGVDTQCSGAACDQVHNRCSPANGASTAQIYPNGPGGIDNSFGRNILPIFLGIQSDYSTAANQRITNGDYTVLFDIGALGAGANYNPLVTGLFQGANLMGMPKFDGTDAWPLDPNDLNDASSPAAGSKTTFFMSYVTHGTWVSGPGGTFAIQLPVGTDSMLISVLAATVSFEMSSDHQSATNGVISGVVDGQAFVDAFKQVAGSIDPSLCAGPTLDSLVLQIQKSQDLMNDGTSGTADQTCNGISIGLGFDGSLVTLGPVAGPTVPNDPCL